MDLSGCSFVTDYCVQMLMDRIDTKSGFRNAQFYPFEVIFIFLQIVCMKWISFSGCEQLTDKSLDHLQKVAKHLGYADFSGCYR